MDGTGAARGGGRGRRAGSVRPVHRKKLHLPCRLATGTHSVAAGGARVRVAASPRACRGRESSSAAEGRGGRRSVSPPTEGGKKAAKVRSGWRRSACRLTELAALRGRRSETQWHHHERATAVPVPSPARWSRAEDMRRPSRSAEGTLKPSLGYRRSQACGAEERRFRGTTEQRPIGSG
jgi:hypothetical protein